MAWIESHQSLQRHKKAMKFARLLSVDRAKAIGHLHFLWWWALDQAQDGDLTNIESFEIAEAAEWPGDENLFFDALVESGFVDFTDDKKSLHDWYDYAGKLIERRAADRERKPKKGDKSQRKSEGSKQEGERKPDGNIGMSESNGGKSEGNPPEIQRNEIGFPDGSIRNPYLNHNHSIVTTTEEDAPSRASESTNLGNCKNSKGLKPDIPLEPLEPGEPPSPLKQLEEAFSILHGIPQWSVKTTCYQTMQAMLEKIPVAFIIETMKAIHKEKMARGGKISTFTYYKDAIIQSYAKEVSKATEHIEIPTGSTYSSGGNKKAQYGNRRYGGGSNGRPVIPVAGRGNNQPTSPEEEAELKRTQEEILKKYSNVGLG